MRLGAFILLLLCLAAAAAPPDEKASLEAAVAEAGSSKIDFIHALEAHLAKYPATERRPEIERSLLRKSIEIGDSGRIIEYGERVLAREEVPLETLERVTRALLQAGGSPYAERALDYARRLERGVGDYEKSQPPDRRANAEMRSAIDHGYGSAYLLEARATGLLGRAAEAVELARKSYSVYPSAESARETARWLADSGNEQEAIRCYAEAFTIWDPDNTEADRAADRTRMGELYRKLKGSETGLGDWILAAYDRTAAEARGREAKLRQTDPNANLTDPMDFTLTGVTGDKLALGSLRGKVLVMDFWATWCGPCVVQHRLYQQLKTRFKDRADVIFLSIDTDDDRGAVPAFLGGHHWQEKVYYDSGLASALRIEDLPTSILIGKRGQIESRMDGFWPDTFVGQLGGRIEEALKR
jgi:thiol-disulfide isomerase/thioredoxin